MGLEIFVTKKEGTYGSVPLSKAESKLGCKSPSLISLFVRSSTMDDNNSLDNI